MRLGESGFLAAKEVVQAICDADFRNNMSQFERDFGCPEGSLSNTFRNNTYMHLHIDKWAQNGAKDRVLRLVEAYKKAVAERQKGNE